MTAPSRTQRDGDAVPLTARSAVVLALTTLIGLMAFGWPLVVDPGAALDDATTAPLVLGAVLLGVLGAVLVDFSDGGLDVRAIAMLGLLAAVGAVLRPLSAGSAGIETVFILLVLGGRAFGAGFGFVLGSVTLLASALLTGGVGPWLPYQMLATSWVGLGAGMLPRVRRGWPEIVLMCGYGAVAALVFGLAMNLSFWPFAIGTASEVSYVAGDPVQANLGRFLAFTIATSLGWDLGRAITTMVGIAVIGPVVLPLLRRAARRARFHREPEARGISSGAR